MDKDKVIKAINTAIDGLKYNKETHIFAEIRVRQTQIENYQHQQNRISEEIYRLENIREMIESKED